MAVDIYGSVKLSGVEHKASSGDIAVLDDGELKYRTAGELAEDIGVPSVIRASGLSVEWTADDSVSGYGYKGKVTLTGCTADHVPIVTFSAKQAASGNYCPYAESAAGCVYIWSNDNTSITVDVVAVM